jgi:hypothetical protein
MTRLSDCQACGSQGSRPDNLSDDLQGSQQKSGSYVVAYGL